MRESSTSSLLVLSECLGFLAFGGFVSLTLAGFVSYLFCLCEDVSFDFFFDEDGDDPDKDDEGLPPYLLLAAKNLLLLNSIDDARPLLEGCRYDIVLDVCANNQHGVETEKDERTRLLDHTPPTPADPTRPLPDTLHAKLPNLARDIAKEMNELLWDSDLLFSQIRNQTAVDIKYRTQFNEKRIQ